MDTPQLIGAGIAAIGLLGSGIGVGNVFGSFLQGALRNPSAASSQQANMFIGAALAELPGLLAFVIAILLYLK
jgi:F-type H+-transporting ATPase subunit c